MPRSPDAPERLVVFTSLLLKTQLEAEAWECQLTLEDYVVGLLTRRGKWARSVGRAGGYDIESDLPVQAARQRREREGR